jgi:tRNA dimethylallyltransferase
VSSKKLVVILGPTASGKTDLAIRMALHFKTEIISADSRQVFKGMRIGTAQPTSEQLAAVPHHFIATRRVSEPYDAASYADDALRLINELFLRHHQVIMCGGSGLYLKAVLEGFDEMPNVPPDVRKQINDEYRDKGLSWLQQEVKAADPAYFEVVDQMNPQRLVRALEIFRGAGVRMSGLRNRSKRQLPFIVVKLGLQIPKPQLEERIDMRVDSMVAEGLFDEAQAFSRQRELNALQTVGYQEVYRFINGEYTRDQAIEQIKKNTRMYAKRQMTWFRKDKEINWFSPGDWDEMINVVATAQ